MHEIFDEIKKLLKETAQSPDAVVHFSDKHFEAIPLAVTHFHNLIAAEQRTIAFVDGGNAELLKASHFSLQLIRTCYSIYTDKKRITSEKKDFYCFTHTVSKDSELFYKTKLLGNTFLEAILDISSMHEHLTQGTNRASVSVLGGIVRRFAELKSAELLIQKLHSNDLIVLDGSLQATYPGEEQYLSSLLHAARVKGVIVCGLSKTSGLMTDSGNSVAAALAKFKREGSWLYHPVAKHESIEIAFVKLHAHSQHVFRFELFTEQKQHLEAVASALSSYAHDPIFLGYPYGLIDVDSKARISNHEKEMMKMYVLTQLGEDSKSIESSLHTHDAHAVLDKISF